MLVGGDTGVFGWDKMQRHERCKTFVPLSRILMWARGFDQNYFAKFQSRCRPASGAIFVFGCNPGLASLRPGLYAVAPFGGYWPEATLFYGQRSWSPIGTWGVPP